MVLKRFVRCQVKNVIAERHRFAVLFGAAVFGVKKVGVRFHLLPLFLIGNIVKQLFVFQRFAIFGEKAVGSRFCKAFSGIFFRQPLKLLIAERFAVLIIQLFCFGIGTCKSLDLLNKFLCRVLILCVVIILHAGIGRFIDKSKLACFCAVHPGFMIRRIIGNGQTKQPADLTEHHRVAALQEFFKEGRVRLVQQVIPQKIVLGAVRFVLIHIDEVEGVASQQRIRAAAVKLFPEIVDEDHKLIRFV